MLQNCFFFQVDYTALVHGEVISGKQEIKADLGMRVILKDPKFSRFHSGKYIFSVSRCRNETGLQVSPVCPMESFEKYDITQLTVSPYVKYNVQLYRVIAAIVRGDIPIQGVAQDAVAQLYAEMLEFTSFRHKELFIAQKDFKAFMESHFILVDCIRELRQRLYLDAISETTEFIQLVSKYYNMPNIDTSMDCEILTGGMQKHHICSASMLSKPVSVCYPNLEVEEAPLLRVVTAQRDKLLNLAVSNYMCGPNGVEFDLKIVRPKRTLFTTNYKLKLVEFDPNPKYKKQPEIEETDPEESKESESCADTIDTAMKELGSETDPVSA